jgi:hypothetical protein
MDRQRHTTSGHRDRLNIEISFPSTCPHVSGRRKKAGRQNLFSLLTYFNYGLDLDRVVLASNMATRERLTLCRTLTSHFRWWSIYVFPLSHTATKIPFMYSLTGNCAALVPIPHSRVCEQYMYIFPRIGPHISCSRIGRSILGVYKSITDT